MPRLNARVDDEVLRKIELLKKAGSATTTEVIKAAIEHYFRDTDPSRNVDVASRLQGLVGIAAGPKDLSSDYKQQLTSIVNEKT